MDGRHSEFAHLRLVNPRTPWQIGLSHFRGFAVLLGILGLAVIAFFSLGKQTLDEQLRSSVEANLREYLASSGHDCTIGSARYLPNHGLVLNDLRITAPSDCGSPIIAVDEIALASDCGISDLLLKNVALQSIDIKRAHCVFARDDEGVWNIDSLINSLTCATGTNQPAMVPVRVRNSSFEFRLALHDESVTYLLRDVQLTATPQGPVGDSESNSTNAANPSPASGLAIRGSLAGNGLDQVSFSVDFDSRTQVWLASVGASGAQIDTHLLKILTRSLNGSWQSRANFRGVLDMQCTARGRLCGLKPDQFQLDGKLSEVSFNDPNLPLAIREGQVEFRVSPTFAHAWNVLAQTDQGSFALEYLQEGSFLAPESWRVHGKGERLSLDRRLLPLLSESFAATFQKWLPEGIFDLDFDITGDPNGIRPTLSATLIDASFEYEKFPYRVEHCVGKLHLQDERCDIDIQALERDRIFRISGQIYNPGANYRGFVDVVLDGEIPLDAKVMRALSTQPKVAETVARFHATGQIGVKARLGRDSPAEEKTQQDFRIQLIDCAVRHDRFDYPFHNVNGLLRIRNDRVDVDNVTAVHGNGNVRCDGVWSRAEGLKLQFLARTVSLDDQLRAAIDPISRQRWAELRPRGVVDLVQVNLVQSRDDAPVGVTVDAQVFPGGEQSETSVTMQPTWFPYSIHNVVGRVSIGDQSIQLVGFRGEHDQAWLSFNGSGSYDDRQWELQIKDLFVSGLESDDQLLAALPANLGQAIKRVHWRGIVNARGEVTVAGKSRAEIASAIGRTGYVSTIEPQVASHPSAITMAWTLRLDSDDAALNVGFPLNSVSGGATINGTFDGVDLLCGGELEVDSLMLGPCQINNIRGPIWIDSQQCAFGSLAQQSSSSPTPRSLTSEFYGGQLRLDGRISLTEEKPFYLEANLAACDMQSWSDDFIPRHKNLFGTGFAAVRLTGDRSGRHSWRGAGKVQLRNARIEVPLISAVGQVVRVTDFEKTVFDESNVDFEIRGDTFDLNQVEIIGRPISLIGNGKVNENREIDLDFYTILGRNKVHIPIVSELYHVGSQQFLHIKVDGDLDDPKTHKTVLPGINEPLKQLVEDLEGRRLPAKD